MKPLKILVFAHVPPPRHGQSLMVQLMLDGFAGGAAEAVTCYHVDARVSDDLADVGGIRAGKLWRLLRHVAAAIRIRFRHGPAALYYIPAPAKRSAVARDLFALSLLRPFFPRLILHWHAVGLGAWAAGEGPKLFGSLDRLARWLAARCLGGADPAISLSWAWESDAGRFRPRRIAVVPNGLPDPFPDGAPAREAGAFRVLYFAMGTREKGVFEALEAFVRFEAPGGREARLTVAGEFPDRAVEEKFRRLLGALEQGGGLEPGQVVLAGHLDTAGKREAFLAHHCLLVPSKHESFGLTLLEAMACGMEIAGFDLGPFREILGDLAEGRLVPVGDCEGLARALVRAAQSPAPEALRERYLAHFTAARWLAQLGEAMRG